MFAPALSPSVLCFIIGLFRLVTFIVFLISCLALPISVCPVLGFRQHCGESPRGGSWSCHRSQPLIKSSNTSWFDQLGRSFAFSSDHTRESPLYLVFSPEQLNRWTSHSVNNIVFVKFEFPAKCLLFLSRIGRRFSLHNSQLTAGWYNLWELVRGNVGNARKKSLFCRCSQRPACERWPQKWVKISPKLHLFSYFASRTKLG